MKQKAKYFSGVDQESCLQAAAAYFGLDSAHLHCEFSPISPELADSGLLLLAMPAQAAQEMDGSFALFYEPEGVFLELYPNRGEGAALRRETLNSYLQRKQLQSLDAQAVSRLLENVGGRAQIAPPQPEKILDEAATLSVSDTEAEAYLQILPADSGGQPLTMDGLNQSLSEAGIVHGVDKLALMKALGEKRYYSIYTVAKATPPAHGEDGYLTFHFEREKSGKPREDARGKVDYRMLDLFESVNQGQLLLTRVLATPGQSGTSVLGKELKPTPGKDVLLPKGKNITVNEEKTAVYAAKSGMVSFVEGSLNVSDVYTVKGDADMNVGNLDFDGSIVISGNVIPGLTIKASGNIEVGGVVEAAELIAGGNINLKRGIQGMDKGKVTATGSVIAGYIERAQIRAGATIQANIIAHSNIEAGDALYVKGKIGSLVGGFARVGNEVMVGVLGSVTETLTEVEVGVVPLKRARYQFVQEEKQKCQQELEKLRTIFTYLEKSPEADAKKQELKKSVSESLNRNIELLQQYTQEAASLEAEFENAAHGKVHVKDSAYANVRITIASSSYKITTPTEHCTFKIVDGQIGFMSYEAK